MKIIKIYQKECTGCGLYKAEMAKLESHAARNGYIIQTIRTPLDVRLYQEANSYGIPQPFSVIDGKAYPLGELPKPKKAKVIKIKKATKK